MLKPVIIKILLVSIYKIYLIIWFIFLNEHSLYFFLLLLFTAKEVRGLN